MPNALRIVDWSKTYENNRTRELKKMDWVPMPNKMDGYGYATLVSHPNGAAHFAAWVAIIEIASRCDTRGILIRDGVALSTAALAMISRLPKTIFDEAIPRLINEIKWIEEIPQEGAGIPQVDAEKPQEGAPRVRVRKGMEGNGTEEKEYVPSPKFNEPDFGSLAAELVDMYPTQIGIDIGVRWYISELSRAEDPLKLHSEVLAGLKRYLASEKWRHRETGELETKFIPNLGNFLGCPTKAGVMPSKMYLDNPPEWKDPRKPKASQALPEYKPEWLKVAENA